MRWQLFLILILIPGSWALGVAPAFNSIQFEPGLEEVHHVRVYNTDFKNFSAGITAEGEFVTPLNRTVSFSDTDSSRIVYYTVLLPETLEPGAYTTRLRIRELSSVAEGDTVVSGRVGVAHKISIHVPKHGKYISIEAELKGKRMSVTFENIGAKTIENISSNIYVENLFREKHDFSLESDEKKTISSSLDYTGEYLYVIDTAFDGQTKVVTKKILLGKPVVDVVSIDSGDFELGEVAKLEIGMESNWNKNLSANLDFQVLKNKRAIYSYTSEDFRISKHKKVNVFWDTKGVEKGSYVARITVNYDGYQSVEEWPIIIRKQMQFVDYKILIIILVMLILVGLIYLIRNVRL